jgi:hypothetical protein
MLCVWLHKPYAVVILLWVPTTVGQQSRMGAPKAITATAHKLARIFYRLWTSGDRYTDPGIDAYEQQYRDRILKNLKIKAQAFGLELIPISTPTECVS